MMAASQSSVHDAQKMTLDEIVAAREQLLAGNSAPDSPAGCNDAPSQGDLEASYGIPSTWDPQSLDFHPNFTPPSYCLFEHEMAVDPQHSAFLSPETAILRSARTSHETGHRSQGLKLPTNDWAAQEQLAGNFQADDLARPGGPSQISGQQFDNVVRYEEGCGMLPQDPISRSPHYEGPRVNPDGHSQITISPCHAGTIDNFVLNNWDTQCMIPCSFESSYVGSNLGSLVQTDDSN